MPGRPTDQKVKILYIEDNRENRMLVRAVLEAAGYAIVDAEDGLTGIEAAIRRAGADPARHQPAGRGRVRDRRDPEIVPEPRRDAGHRGDRVCDARRSPADPRSRLRRLH